MVRDPFILTQDRDRDPCRPSRGCFPGYVTCGTSDFPSEREELFGL